jgi:hypothetical protein
VSENENAAEPCGSYFGLSGCDRPLGHEGNHQAAVVPYSYTPEQEAAAMAHYGDQVAKSTMVPPAIVGMTLVEFIRACLDEDQRVADELTLLDPAPWSAEPNPSAEGTWEIVDAQRETVVHSDDDCCMTRDLAEWIAAWDPSRVLAEIAAKRAILDFHEACGTGSGYCDDIGHPGSGENCVTTLYLAQPYRDRDGFDERWTL